MNVYLSAEHVSHTLNVDITYANPVHSQKCMAENAPLPQLRCPFQDAQTFQILNRCVAVISPSVGMFWPFRVRVSHAHGRRR